MAEDLNRYFTKEDIQLDNRCTKDINHHLLSWKCKSKPNVISSHTCENGSYQNDEKHR